MTEVFCLGMSSLKQTAAIVRHAERGFETSKTLQGWDELGRCDDHEEDEDDEEEEDDDHDEDEDADDDKTSKTLQQEGEDVGKDLTKVGRNMMRSRRSMRMIMRRMMVGVRKVKVARVRRRMVEVMVRLQRRMKWTTLEKWVARRRQQ